MGATGVTYGASATSQAFVAGDRGCLPIIAGGHFPAVAGAVTGTNQGTTAQHK